MKTNLSAANQKAVFNKQSNEKVKSCSLIGPHNQNKKPLLIYSLGLRLICLVYPQIILSHETFLQY